MDEENYHLLVAYAAKDGRTVSNLVLHTMMELIRPQRERVRRDKKQELLLALTRKNGQEGKAPGWVYCISISVNGNVYHKIGHTKYIKKRYKALGVDSPLEAKEVGLVGVGDRCSAERYLHERWKEYRVSGEWFDFSSIPIERVLDSMSEIKGAIQP